MLHIWWEPCQKHEQCRVYRPMMKHPYGGQTIPGMYVHVETLSGSHPKNYAPRPIKCLTYGRFAKS